MSIFELAKKYTVKKFFTVDKDYEKIVKEKNLEGLKKEYRRIEPYIVVDMIVQDTVSHLEMLKEYVDYLQSEIEGA